MTIHILTLFPEILETSLKTSIIGRAQKQGVVNIIYHQLRNWAVDKRGTVDGRPYGGGVGMILRVEPIFNALRDIKKGIAGSCHTILLTPQGPVYTQKRARELTHYQNLILVCPHYEGYDERIAKLVDEGISIGNYILTGGEIPALVVVDSVVRLLPRTLKKAAATTKESFTKGGDLEHPQYTRPEVFKRRRVPPVLLSGHHQKIAQWQNQNQGWRGV